MLLAVPTPSPAQRLAARALGIALDNPAAVYLASLTTPASRASMASSLRRAARYWGSTLPELDWSTVTFAHVSALRSWLSETNAPATGNKVLCAIRGVLHQARRLGKISLEAETNACDVPPIRGERLVAGRAVSQEELGLLVEACGTNGRRGLRDRALLALLYAAGLRISEALGLDVEDVDRPLPFTVRGKGNKQRRVFLTPAALDALRAWLAVRLTLAPHGPLFVRLVRGKWSVARLTPNGALLALWRVAEQAKVAHLSPHDLRRTFCGDLLDRGVDLRTVQALMGHENVQTTARYDRRPDRVRQLAADQLTFPS